MRCWVVDVSQAKVITWPLLDPHPQRMTATVGARSPGVGCQRRQGGRLLHWRPG
jgi:hypothetical protein